ncbi:unnamed protein product [marine sediment metagenome]|uniref:Uncharacterized protein n=1 Tax=marine sediment metagenome TaxID=412755 RepID=X1RWJ5_9ZZZZ
MDDINRANVRDPGRCVNVTSEDMRAMNANVMALPWRAQWMTLTFMLREPSEFE